MWRQGRTLKWQLVIQHILWYFFVKFCNAEKRRRFLLTQGEEVDMEKKDLKKLLAGLSIASLIAGAGLSVTGCASTGWSAEKSGAGSTEMEKSSTAKEAPAKKPAGGSGWN